MQQSVWYSPHLDSVFIVYGVYVGMPVVIEWQEKIIMSIPYNKWVELVPLVLYLGEI